MQDQGNYRALCAAIERLFTIDSYANVSETDLKKFGENPVYVHAFNWRKLAQTMEETVDNVREALGLEETHYLVIADDVADVVRERNMYREACDFSEEETLP